MWVQMVRGELNLMKKKKTKNLKKNHSKVFW